MVSQDRQRVIETNRSLRLIKNELESLLEKGIITDAAFDSISALLPAESPLSGGARNANQPLPTPALSTASPAATTPSPAPSQQQQQQPPSYAQSASAAAAAANPPPALPSRTAAAAAAPAAPPPPPPPAKPVLARARALYRYAATDARDVSLERDDAVAVHEYMNADWWMGRNERTGQEGIFPRSYVVVVLAGEEGGGEKQQQQQFNNYNNNPVAVGGGAPGGGYYPVAPVPVGGYYPPAPQAVQQPQQEQQPQQQEGGNKMGEHGKKFGKKLGNAAIFGAGATIGSNLVNSIF